jgi:DNA-binding response OmpR family regulator
MVRLLLVEDDELLGAGIEDSLTRARYAVERVRSGPLALAALEQGGFDAIVLDLGLPGMDGLEVLKRARAAGSVAPVLILSARDTVAQRVAGLDAGADDYRSSPSTSTSCSHACARCSAARAARRAISSSTAACASIPCPCA